MDELPNYGKRITILALILMNIFFQWLNNQNINRNQNDTFKNTQNF